MSGRYEGTRPLTEALGRARDVFTPPGVVEHVLTADDRLDLLAHHYYGDARLWWRILDANPGVVCGADLRHAVGRVIVIPSGSA